MELRTGQGTMSSSLPALFCLGLCLEQVIHAHYGPLPKPSLQALPSSLVPLGTPVTVRCQGPPGVDLYRLEKLKSSQYFDYGVLSFSAMEKRFAGVYRCSYQNGSRWSLPSSQLELVATGVFTKPSLSAQPSAAVSPGMDVTLRCESQYGFDRFALYKEGDTGPYKRPEQWYLADFPITTVTAANSGTYRCYSFSSSSPYLWSAPSDPLELVVKGNSVTPSWLPTELPSSVTAHLDLQIQFVFVRLRCKSHTATFTVPARLAIIIIVTKKHDCWRGFGDTGTLIPCWWGKKCCSCCGKQLGGPLKS